MDLLPLSTLAGKPADQLAYLAHAARETLAAAISEDEATNNGAERTTVRSIYTEALASYAQEPAGRKIVRPTTDSYGQFLAFEGRLNNAISAMRITNLPDRRRRPMMVLPTSFRGRPGERCVARSPV